MTIAVLGSDLKVGDVIEVWWRPGRDTITALRPYKGSLKCFEPEGASLADFALNKVGMTIEHGHVFTCLSRT